MMKKQIVIYLILNGKMERNSTASERQFAQVWPVTRREESQKGKRAIILRSNSDWCCQRKNDMKFSAHWRHSKWKEAARATSLLSCEAPFHLLELTSTMMICLMELHYFISCFEQKACIVVHCYGGKRCSDFV